jgi:hypothetical protein
MDKVQCRYWIIIDDFKTGERPVVHLLVREIHWSTGWGGARAKGKDEVERIGPFNTKQELIGFYYPNKANLHGGTNARTIDQATDGNCGDQA